MVNIFSEITCPELINPENGVVSVDNNNLNGVAEYTCNEGFKLDGDPILTCLESEHWSTQPPICLGKNTLV